MSRPREFSLVGALIAVLLGAPAAATSLRFVTQVFPPLVSLARGRAVGPMVDVLQAACAAIQTTCTVDVMPWCRGLPLAEQGLYDGAFVLLWLPEREQLFYMPPGMVTSAYSLFGLQGSKLVYQQPQDLSGRTIVVYGPSGTETAVESVLRNVATIHLQREGDNRTVLRKLAAGRYGPDALAVVNRDVGLSLIQSEPLPGIRLLSDLEPISYTIGLSRRAVPAALAGRFLSALAALKQAGTLSAIFDKWRAKPPA